jgi:dolichol-phosphate mannosyltransferase
VYPIAGVRDYSSGYRAYNAGFLQDAVRRGSGALFAQEGFECMAAILIRLHKAGARFDEVPLILRYDRKRGRSKMRVFRTVRRSLSLLIRERFSAD